MADSNKIEVVYEKAKLGKRMLAHFIDIGIFLFTAIILFTLSNMIVTHTDYYQNKQEKLAQMRDESGLYLGDESILKAVENEEKFPTYFDRKNALSEALESFYSNVTYFDSDFSELANYRNRQLEATDGGVSLFVQDGDLVKENSLYNNDEGWFNFYYSEIDDHAMAFLLNNEEYFSLTTFNFWSVLIQVIVMGTISFTIYYLVLPLTCFKRGRQTIGMKLEKIALINVQSFSLSTGVYIARFFFMMVIFIYLNFFAFLIPTIVSVSMMFLSKTNSSLVNYVFNDYMVNCQDQQIYLSPLEREEAEIKLQSVSIENTDFTLK